MEENLITAYKVVEDKTRWSTNWACYKKYKYKKTVPRSKYTKKYLLNKRVYKVKGSVGLMAFKDYQDAVNFISHTNKRVKLIIIKVIGKLCEDQICLILRNAAGDNFIHIGRKDLSSVFFQSPPAGTLFFDWLKALE